MTTWAVLLLFAGGPAVRVEVFETVPQENKLPAELAGSREWYAEPAFAFSLLPWGYAGTGVRVDRPAVFAVRATADVVLPAGEYRVLVRARNAARMTVDGTPVLALPFAVATGDGASPVRRDALVLGPTRHVAPGDREKLAAFTATGSPQRFAFEFLVGGVRGAERLRPEVGETLVAVAAKGSDEFRLLAPAATVPLTDTGWEQFAAERRAAIDRLEAGRRAAAFAADPVYWESRRKLAAAFVAANPPPPVPAATPGFAASSPVDHFLNGPLAAAVAPGKGNGGAVQYHRDIKPIFAAKCGSCHGAAKPRGGFRIDDRTAVLAAGVVPGKPGESEIVKRIQTTDADTVMPPKGEKLTRREVELVEAWVTAGADWPAEAPVAVKSVTPLTTDAQFLRRVSLDIVGTVPTAADARAFLTSIDPDKRTKLIDKLLADPRWADSWVPYWQDALAENPNIVNPTLNNSGPFRWWLYETFRDNKPWDVAVTELVTQAGSPLGGGPAGFGLAAQNDAPAAAKAGVLATAFLATEMKCARCHDAPYHAATQADLFRLAAMLDRKPLAVPATSSVPADKLGRKPLITVTLKPGTKVKPGWSLTKLLDTGRMPPLPPGDEDDTREQLAALITSPENERFAEVTVNRVWRKYLGRGLVEPPHDWERAAPSHPTLLKFLAREFIRGGYDVKHVARMILTSQAYQRRASPDAELVRAFAAPAQRRLGPEALADSLFDAFGRTYDCDPIGFDPDGSRPWKMGMTFGVPRRAWEFPYLSNDRDRPSLSLPKAQAVTDLLTAFGWDGNRQTPVSDRAAEPMIAQAAQLANGIAASWLTRLSDDSLVTQLCLDAPSPAALADELFLRTLTRFPTAAERAKFVALLSPGFEGRVLTRAIPPAPPKTRQPYAAWVNHHTDDALVIRHAEAVAARAGPPPTKRLTPDWRDRAEDALWALLNHPDAVYIP